MNLFNKNKVVILTITILALVLLAWLNRFILDDAFISFRYAYNFAHGHGLVWNIGERVEGYTNFLWTMIMTIPMFFNWDPVFFSYVAGVGLFFLSLWFTYKTALLISGSEKVAFFAMLFLGTSYSFSAYATSGLETQLQTCLSLVVAFLFLRVILNNLWNPWLLVGISFLSALAMLTRLDSVVILTVPYLVAFFYLLKEQIDFSTKAKRVVFLCFPVVGILLVWLAWKLWFYGDIIPNTYYAKAISEASAIRGLYYVYLFFLSYCLIPFVLLFLVFSKKIIKSAGLVTLSATAILWIFYVIKVGGDYMEFRFLIPVLPFIFILISSLIFSFVKTREVKIALVLLVLVGSLHHFFTFGLSTYRGSIDSIPNMYGNIINEDEALAGIGKLLSRAFDKNAKVTIAVTAAGVVPYYSRLTTIDMHGLSDKWVALHGVRLKFKPGRELLGNKPGHSKYATLGYLIKRKVNLLSIQPWIVKKESVLSL
ncbi:hypothetical protein A2548_02460, partial [candidate division WOR-1 bacterium RIFOXYD2_FULL_41_8]